MKIEEELLKLIVKAEKENEIPVAAIITCEGKIVAKAYNKKNKNKNLLDHAEIIAIKKAMKKKKDWRLANCKLYVTLEPCEMCKKIIEESRISEVYYYISKSKKNNYKTNYIKQNNIYSKIYLEKLQKLFKKLRNSKE